MKNYDIHLAHRTVGKLNMYTFRFTATQAVNAYNQGTNEGRIVFYFPTDSTGDYGGYASDLGTGKT